MEALGLYLPPPASAQWLAQAVLAGALVVTSVLERFQVRLAEAEPARWWASNGRDLVNALALATLWLALRVGGYSGPIALAAAALLLLAAVLAQSGLDRLKWVPDWVSYLAMGAIGSPILVAPGAVHALVRSWVEALARA